MVSSAELLIRWTQKYILFDWAFLSLFEIMNILYIIDVVTSVIITPAVINVLVIVGGGCKNVQS